MKLKPKPIILIGLLLVIIGIIGAIISYYVIIEDPGEVYEEKLIFNSSDSDPYDDTISKTISINKGDYDIWYEPDFTFFAIIGSPSELRIKDPDGEIIFDESSLLGRSEAKISRDGKDYRRYGTFKADQSGDYEVSTDSSATIYITPHIKVELGEGLGMTFIVIVVIGIIIMIIGAYLFFASQPKPKPISPPAHQTPPPQPQPYPYYYHYPQYSHYPPYPQYPQSQYPGYSYPPPQGPPPPPQGRTQH